ncbi:MAG: hypothetical protein WD689_02905 [Gaiellaceae bacterium]
MGQVVSSYAIDDGERLLIFDPLEVPSEIAELVGQRETAIVLTCPWHHRDGEELSAAVGRAALPAAARRRRRQPVPHGGVHGALVAGDTLADRQPVARAEFSRSSP